MVKKKPTDTILSASLFSCVHFFLDNSMEVNESVGNWGNSVGTDCGDRFAARNLFEIGFIHGWRNVNELHLLVKVLENDLNFLWIFFEKGFKFFAYVYSGKLFDPFITKADISSLESFSSEETRDEDLVVGTSVETRILDEFGCLGPFG